MADDPGTNGAAAGTDVLPDPTQDLHWSGFRGAIHDIFHQNALRHPDRPCVVETAGRSFSYRQIDEASNILAHHLVQSGVQREEVAMVYAHRGVDLVVAVMGVLKAGATFSVIDPAYPPERQNIYLDVARPRALVVIEKASKEAGDVSEIVRQFIVEKLQLRTEVPALALQDDGTLLGGSYQDVDVLEAQRPLGTHTPGVVVGPDSTPTLSFTSGSEGRPKGVCGRHFSLAYYFPWMAEKFHLSQDDRFTMLSGIAHDPIQRDIFTPLFLGARLLVPTRDDIQHERLAEWMREHRATVTHLTPAMGQILVGGASAEFPSLHHAFFVGDILIKRDCRSLQRLAHNVNIVNMYGTTETQRAVSFFEIPCWNHDPKFLAGLKDVIPAGRGMMDVQLLVVDRANRSKLCAVGEIGELYVRAGGLAEGYLGMPELTKEKFVPNWFIDPQSWIDQENRRTWNKELEPWRAFLKGPRDRLYKTGDLGRYMPSGDVECCGRVDDQVKIRGFRIELGDIDTNLSQHPLIRENVTLVRRDKDEEPTLISYIVPDSSKWPQWLQEKGLREEMSGDGLSGMLRRYRALRDDARDHLRSKLPNYMVPTVIVPLERMPLNPNGKIDKPRLPFPDSAELSASSIRRLSASSAPLSDTELALAKIWAKLIPHISARFIGADDSFFDLGGHSILAQQMFFAVKQQWNNVAISMTAIFRDPTLRGFAAEIDRAESQGNPCSTSSEGGADVWNGAVEAQGEDYAADAKRLVEKLAEHYPVSDSSTSSATSGPITVLVTGATGFLGAYILRDLLGRHAARLHVVAHVRARNAQEAFDRVRLTCQAYGVWSADWTGHLRCVNGNLGEPRLGLDSSTWKSLTEQVDVVIHNGAWVHWVYPYSNLKSSNVQGTLDALALCATGKAKRFVFVSSTSVLDTPHYTKLSDQIVREGGKGISETDNLEGSSRGLGNGYGQSKWVGEYLVKEAGRRGLTGSIVRPGYVTGDSRTGVTNTDDFLIRMAKGCIQLGCRPDIPNTVNMVPVDHVALVVVASALHPPVSPLGVVHVTSLRRLRFDEYLATLATFGYDVAQVEYKTWRTALEKYVSNGDNEVHALMPLYHYVTSDLPASTVAPELDDRNATLVLEADAKVSDVEVVRGSAVSEGLIGGYLAYLVAVGFLPAPPVGHQRRPLPPCQLGDEQREALGKVGGRGRLV
ncbi:MAG: putative NRPS-like protein biosynthetic cluster [Thelocarpon impressellum]|nr:MAG: putative NRPS-like protein biosynthetic cluster [Thelocarpon impressellum]